MRGRAGRIAAVLAAAGLTAGLLGGCSSDPKLRTITVTFVRHAQSEANAEGVINTEVPGPGLTAEGQGQAEQIARQLGTGGYDGVYASSMVRTQQTARPLADALGQRVEVLPGLNEIDAGWYEGEPSDRAELTYLLAPTDWIHGDRANAIPGSIDGNEFNDQFGAAVQKIYASGDTKPVVFSHSVAIAFWTLMNVRNPKLSLATDHPLPNLGRVVITGNPATGWRLIDWDGIRSFN